jgi:hypothetical protein
MCACCGPACYARTARSLSVQGGPPGHPCSENSEPRAEHGGDACVAACCARIARSPSDQGVASRPHPCDACVAPLATAPISQTGS